MFIHAVIQELHHWDVQAQCASLFHGTAKVEECDKNGTPYGTVAPTCLLGIKDFTRGFVYFVQLSCQFAVVVCRGISGCEPDTCLEPSDATGYVITATSLELHKQLGKMGNTESCQTAKCIHQLLALYPRASTICPFRFSVATECAFGYIGSPKAVKCPGHGKEYTLDTW